MSIAWKTDLKGSNKLVLLALADNASDEGYCWPSWKTLMDKTGVSKATLSGVLKTLEKQKYIKRMSRKRENGSDASNGYFVIKNIEEDGQSSETEHHPEVQNLNPQSSETEHLEPSEEPSVICQDEKPLSEMDQRDLEVCKYLFKKVKELFPSTREPDFSKWAKPIKLMREKQGREHSKIVNMIEAIFDGNEYYSKTFWRMNIRSTEKLKSNYERLAVELNDAYEKYKKAM